MGGEVEGVEFGLEEALVDGRDHGQPVEVVVEGAEQRAAALQMGAGRQAGDGVDVAALVNRIGEIGHGLFIFAEGDVVDGRGALEGLPPEESGVVAGHADPAVVQRLPQGLGGLAVGVPAWGGRVHHNQAGIEPGSELEEERQLDPLGRAVEEFDRVAALVQHGSGEGQPVGIEEIARFGHRRQPVAAAVTGKEGRIEEEYAHGIPAEMVRSCG